jgi:protein-S-isoprenylcysteine O-methyltransferase Ste14
MSMNMTVFGIGKKLGLITLPFLATALWAGYRLPAFFSFDHVPIAMLLGIGIGLIVIGLGVNFYSATFMMKAFRQHRLVTKGPFAVSRNPMYTSFILFTIPGIALAFNNWLVLICSLVVFLGITLLVKEEEVWLEETFGQEYKTYKSRTGRVFPKVW